jgi:hypothetical protein
MIKDALKVGKRRHLSLVVPDEHAAEGCLGDGHTACGARISHVIISVRCTVRPSPLKVTVILLALKLRPVKPLEWHKGDRREEH